MFKPVKCNFDACEIVQHVARLRQPWCFAQCRGLQVMKFETQLEYVIIDNAACMPFIHSLSQA